MNTPQINELKPIDPPYPAFGATQKYYEPLTRFIVEGEYKESLCGFDTKVQTGAIDLMDAQEQLARLFDEYPLTGINIYKVY